jgi:hypothetical protein
MALQPTPARMLGARDEAVSGPPTHGTRPKATRIQRIATFRSHLLCSSLAAHPVEEFKNPYSFFLLRGSAV